MITVKNFDLPKADRKEILRYAGVKSPDSMAKQALENCLKISENAFDGRVCFDRFPVQINGDLITFPTFKTESRDLAKNLSDCDSVVLFAATVGSEIDRLIRRYSVTDMSYTVWLQAIGTERIEALCNRFNDYIESELALENRFTKPRFSAGYGDLPLELQRPVTQALDTGRKIGITLNESLLMSPSKSVTAFIGTGRKESL